MDKKIVKVKIVLAHHTPTGYFKFLQFLPRNLSKINSFIHFFSSDLKQTNILIVKSCDYISFSSNYIKFINVFSCPKYLLYRCPVSPALRILDLWEL